MNSIWRTLKTQCLQLHGPYAGQIRLSNQRQELSGNWGLCAWLNKIVDQKE